MRNSNINIYKLINGKSVFGMRSDGTNIFIGSLVIDDVHACLGTTESQFTIVIKSDDKNYDKILNIFVEDLKQQSETKLLDICECLPYTNMLVPFWAWHKKINDIIKILHESRDDSNIVFSWPLIKECLINCNCVISTEKIEITPKSIPIHKISGFSNAKRRVFTSATLSDDSIFVSHLDIETDNIKTIITPEYADDIGDRFILFPQAINSSINDNMIKEKCKELSASQNVVVIVPSTYRANYWNDVADLLLNTSNLNEGVQRLKLGHVGLAVLINKYDGIDLPENACRVLVIDGLPDTRSEYDKIEEAALFGSQRILNEKVQRVEQGMGRGVRSNTDYCVVLLMGRSLTNILYGEAALEKFSISTRAQIQLSEKISDQAKGKSIDEIFEIIDYSLQRNLEWVTASKSVLSEIKYDRSKNINPVILAYRKAFNNAEKRDYVNSIKVMNDIVNNTEDILLRGWLKQQLAEYTDFLNPIDSQNILKSALYDNNQVIKPIEGIQFEKNLKKYTDQGAQFIDFIAKQGLDENKYILHINDILACLVFKPDSASVFEKAVSDIASCIGFSANRPEKEGGKGPDDLWRIGELKFLIIECKNGVTNEAINKHDCNQLNGSINWFKTQYGSQSCEYIPIMIHLGNIFEYECSPDPGIRIINREKLELLKDNISEFAKAVVINGNFNNIERVSALLREYKLASNYIVDIYTTPFTIKK